MPLIEFHFGGLILSHSFLRKIMNLNYLVKGNRNNSLSDSWPEMNIAEKIVKNVRTSIVKLSKTKILEDELTKNRSGGLICSDKKLLKFFRPSCARNELKLRFYEKKIRMLAFTLPNYIAPLLLDDEVWHDILVMIPD